MQQNHAQHTFPAKNHGHGGKGGGGEGGAASGGNPDDSGDMSSGGESRRLVDASASTCACPGGIACGRSSARRGPVVRGYGGDLRTT